MNYKFAGSVGLCLMVCLGLLAISFVIVNKPTNPTSVQAVKASIQKDIPLNSNVTQVLRFLDSRHISHNDQVGADGLLYAVIEDTSWTPFSKSNIQIAFAFHQNRMVRFSVTQSSSDL